MATLSLHLVSLGRQFFVDTIIACESEELAKECLSYFSPPFVDGLNEIHIAGVELTEVAFPGSAKPALIEEKSYAPITKEQRETLYQRIDAYIMPQIRKDVLALLRAANASSNLNSLSDEALLMRCAHSMSKACAAARYNSFSKTAQFAHLILSAPSKKTIEEPSLLDPQEVYNKLSPVFAAFRSDSKFLMSLRLRELLGP